MSIKIDEDANEAFIFQWKIENASHCWWMRRDDIFHSPVFYIDKDSKWSLGLDASIENPYIRLFLRREKDCGGPDFIEINYQLSFLTKDGLYLKEKLTCRNASKQGYWGFPDFVMREKVFVTESESFLPEDSLTVQCIIYTLDKKPVKSSYIFATSDLKLKRRSFEWQIDKICTLKSEMKNKFTDNSVGLDLVLNDGLDKLDVNMTSFHDGIQYFSCNTSIIDSEGKTESCGIQKFYLRDFEEKRILSFTVNLPKISKEGNRKYFPNDVLTFYFDCVVSYAEHFLGRKVFEKLVNEVVGKEKSENTNLIENFKSLYIDGIFSDVVLRTSTKSFPAHKGILSVRSPVFMRMFSSEMKEKISGQVDISDFEDDTIHRMLLYIYTDTVGDLQFEIASKLYKIADKYQILALKSTCSCFLKENLCAANACDALILADLYNDGDFRIYVEDYILKQDGSFFDSREWKDFMNNHLEAAAYLMCKRITTQK